MTHIYLIDYIGIHCGMHYYLESFKKVLEEIPETTVKVLSNYSDALGEEPFFLNHYKGGKAKKVLSLITNYRRFQNFVKTHPKAVFIYLAYGNHIDLAFMGMLAKTSYHVIDIHEGIAQNLDSVKWLRNAFKKLYVQHINNVISHSSRTNDFLREFGYRKKVFSVPHFKYSFPRIFDKNNIPEEIFKSVATDKKKILFFGNLNINKGIDILIDAVNGLPEEYEDKVAVIVAGKDFDGSIDLVKPKGNVEFHIFRRHISDDELTFLYQNVDFIALPYRKTSQSGILEMAFYFKKPIIASDLPYFRKTLAEFPSFGVLAGNGTSQYTKSLQNILSLKTETQFFLLEDYNRYENRREILAFREDFHKWLKRGIE